MKFAKRHLCDLSFCYAAASIQADGREKFLFATDDTGPCRCIDSETFETENVWDGPGGTMSIIPVPGTDGDFLASQNFLPGFSALHARIVRVRRENGAWQVQPWLDMPYVHRFDILERDGVRYLLCCILSSTEMPQADMACPGRLIAAELSDDFSAPAEFTVIADGMTKNHGYCRVERDGYAEAFTACDEGVFSAVPPEHRGGRWEVRKILDAHASDIAVCDIDGDGAEELAVIEPFHGSDFVVYHKTSDGYKEMYRYPEKMEFVHAAWGGMLRGEPVFLGGCRAVNKELFMLRWKNGKIQAETIETGYGPSNVAVLHGRNEDRILAANRESAEAALFMVYDD